MKKTLLSTIITLSAALAIAGSCAAQTNLVVNGGFETSPALGVVPSGWTRIANSYGLYDGRYGGMAAHTGKWMMHAGADYKPGGEYQDLTTLTPSTNYTLSFWAVNWAGKGTAQGQVLIGTPGTNNNSLTLNNNAQYVSSTFNVLSTAWTQYTYSFNTTSAPGTVRLSLINYGATAPAAPAISFDDVELTAAAVPEPSSLLAASTVLGLFGFAKRRRQ